MKTTTINILGTDWTVQTAEKWELPGLYDADGLTDPSTRTITLRTHTADDMEDP